MYIKILQFVFTPRQTIAGHPSIPRFGAPPHAMGEPMKVHSREVSRNPELSLGPPIRSLSAANALSALCAPFGNICRRYGFSGSPVVLQESN